jgi:ribosomal protein L30/L7E
MMIDFKLSRLIRMNHSIFYNETSKTKPLIYK